MVNSRKFLGTVSGLLIRCSTAFRVRHRSITSMCWHMQKLTSTCNEMKTSIKMIAPLQQEEMKEPMEQIQKVEPVKKEKEQCQQQLQEIAKPIVNDEEEPSFMINDFLVRFYGSVVELEKELPTDHIHIYFNISKSMPRHLREYVKKLKNPNPVHSVPDFEVVVKRGDWILSLYCGFKIEVFLNDKLPLDENNQLDVFEIKDITIFQHLWDEFTYTANQYSIDHDVLNNIKKTLMNLGITNEFALKMSYLATAHADAANDKFLDNLLNFGINVPKKAKNPAQTSVKRDGEVN